MTSQSMRFSFVSVIRGMTTFSLVASFYYTTCYYNASAFTATSITTTKASLLVQKKIITTNIKPSASYRQHQQRQQQLNSTPPPSSNDSTDMNSNTLLRDTKSEAQDALNSVGWSIPNILMDDKSKSNTAGNSVDNMDNVAESAELTSNDPFVQMIDQSIQNDIGVSLEDLLNPAKVVNLERDLYNYRIQLASLTGKELRQDQEQQRLITTVECDNGGGGIEADEIRTKIQKKEADLMMERRSVFRNWLKNLFLIQAVLSFGLSYIMATNSQLLFGNYDWYLNPKYNMDISISVLGYWWWWLFVIPSLRSRRPKGYEKQALDIAFIASPIISLIEPIATKDTGIIWMTNCFIVVAAYGYSYVQYNVLNNDDDDDDDSTSDNSKNTQQAEWIKFVYKSLDFGSGRERGARN